jgi:hypothetical protein
VKTKETILLGLKGTSTIQQVFISKTSTGTVLFFRVLIVQCLILKN